MLNIEDYKKSNVPQKYWNLIADYLSTCGNNEKHGVYNEGYGDYYARDEELIKFSDLLDELKIPKSEWKNIENDIRCPECGKKIKLNSFVSINHSFKTQRYYTARIQQIEQKTKDQLQQFEKSLVEYPLLGLISQNDVGHIIEKEISKYIKDEIKEKIYYRARNIDSKDCSRIFSTADMGPCPKDCAKEERYSHNGQSALYLGDSTFDCLAELNHGNYKKIAWMQKIKVQNVKVLNLIKFLEVSDLKDCPVFVAGLLFNGTITKKTEDKGYQTYYKPEYAVTRFIADLCRYYDFDGVIYPSSVFSTQDKVGENLVLFEKAFSKYEFIGEPYIYNGSEHVQTIGDSNFGPEINILLSN